MSSQFGEPIVKSKLYKNVYKIGQGNNIKWKAQIMIEGEQLATSGLDEERQAAILVDTWLIQRGKPPVNILKPVKGTKRRKE